MLAKAVIFTIALLFQVSGVVAYPMFAVNYTMTYTSAPTSLRESRNVTQHINAPGTQHDTYYLTMVGTVLTVLSLCLTFVTTLIAIFDFVVRVRSHTRARRRGGRGESRNPINDEASREACDALAQPNQFNEIAAANGVPLATLSAAATQTDPLRLSMPSERPSQSYDHVI